MINLFLIMPLLGNHASMLAPTFDFSGNGALLASSPEHASNLEKQAKDIKRMKYWMLVTIG